MSNPGFHLEHLEPCTRVFMMAIVHQVGFMVPTPCKTALGLVTHSAIPLQNAAISLILKQILARRRIVRFTQLVVVVQMTLISSLTMLTRCMAGSVKSKRTQDLDLKFVLKNIGEGIGGCLLD